MRLVVFDWDGTLMDSPRRIVHCLQRTCVTLGCATPPETALREIIGLGVEAAVQELFPGADANFVGEFVVHYRRCYLTATDAPETPLFPHVLPMLDWLDERGILLGVATGKSRAGLDQALEATGLRGRFVATACGDEHPSKPSPVMLEHVMERSGVERSRTRMVGDSVYDLRMARAAGVAALAVAHGVHDARRLAAEGPLAVARDLQELLDLWRGEQAGPSTT